MGVFTGTHTNKVDKKGRVSVPKTFRALFEREVFQGVYVFPSFRQPALEACPESFMERIVDSLEDLPMFSDEQDDLSIIIESAERLAFDPEGRVVISYASARKPAFERAKTRGLTLKLRRHSDRASDGGEG
mgnify:CR=1 FL=1